MRETTASVVVLFVLVGMVIAVPAAALTGDAGDRTGERRANATIEPGAQFAGIVGIQKAEVEGDVESRSFAVAARNARTNASKASVVAEQIGDLEERLDALSQRKQELERARENGSLSAGQYRARIGEIAARTATVQRLANQTRAVARGLPGDALRAKGINASAIRTLRRKARNVSGPEVAEIARSIAGPGAGKGLGAGPPGRNGTPPGLAGGGPRGNGSAGPPTNGTGGPNDRPR